MNPIGVREEPFTTSRASVSIDLPVTAASKPAPNRLWKFMLFGCVAVPVYVAWSVRSFLSVREMLMVSDPAGDRYVPVAANVPFAYFCFGRTAASDAGATDAEEDVLSSADEAVSAALGCIICELSEDVSSSGRFEASVVSSAPEHPARSARNSALTTTGERDD